MQDNGEVFGVGDLLLTVRSAACQCGESSHLPARVTDPSSSTEPPARALDVQDKGCLRLTGDLRMLLGDWHHICV